MNKKEIFCLSALIGSAIAAHRLLLWRGRDHIASAEGLRTKGNLLRIARVGPISVALTASVLDAVRTMEAQGVGAVLVTDSNETLKGILTERDVTLRVMLRKRAPETTPVSEAMTSSPVTVQYRLTSDEALQVMAKKRIRHLPVVGESGKVEGMLSLRHLLGQKAENLEQNLDSLVAHVSADGIGG